MRKGQSWVLQIPAPCVKGQSFPQHLLNVVQATQATHAFSTHNFQENVATNKDER